MKNNSKQQMNISIFFHQMSSILERMRQEIQKAASIVVGQSASKCPPTS
jgi:hypothetical protein